MSSVIGVRFSEVGKIYYFDPGNLEIEMGDKVVVETVRGVEFGEVVLAPREMTEKEIVKPLKKVVKKADEKDFKKLEKNKKRQKEAFDICTEKIGKHKMDMKLIDVEYTFDGGKIIFYFTAEGRVDFRELVKELASVFKTRIELRQIGVRDEAKKIGGLGPCGRPCCCSAFLGDFQPVSIKMAKDQNLSLSPTKISGLCGRLMCCLNYEQEHYHQMRKKLPRVGAIVMTCDGEACVIDTNALTEKIRAKRILPDGTFEIREYDLADIKVNRNKRPGAPAPAEEEAASDEEIKNLLKD
ncbi:MAG: stage 0 sporulation family protein [Christensenella sp.]|uniref:PSP1 domain-containing protein n=1 Tax=Christensenella sp. TaxID=1935934 RepID=UPI002B1FC93C|nr:stage 0 sporulation family protein [Christensenella sp.]MEA5003300.1 stage 0 sporulation family protein [Christensenella sp.]